MIFGSQKITGMHLLNNFLLENDLIKTSGPTPL